MKILTRTWCKMDKKMYDWDNIRMDPYSFFFKDTPYLVRMLAAYNDVDKDWFRFKDGEIVFDGDIYKNDNDDELFEVIFHGGCFWTKPVEYDLVDGGFLFDVDTRNYTLMGNIYKHKHLTLR